MPTFNPSAVLKCHLITGPTFQAISALPAVPVIVAGEKDGLPGHLLIHCAERGGSGSDFCGYSVSMYCAITLPCVLQPIQRIKGFAIWYIILLRINGKDTSVQCSYKTHSGKNSFTLYQWCTQEFFSVGGFNKFSWGQRTERTGIWGRQPPSQGFWRQL